MTNPIEAAVSPLKEDAIKRAAQEAMRIVDHLTRRLAECEGNADVLAPRPDWRDGAYKEKMGRRQLLESISKSTKLARPYSEPDIRVIDADRVAKFVQDAMDNAAAQYEAFVAKLCKKIWHCESAELDGNHVWGYSILTVTYNSGTVERFKTQMIVNVSKHGKLFNQWPTRKVKR